ncbi:Molybdenum cofactor biosynthesis protein 1, partial [Tetrabaena socialis]
ELDDFFGTATAPRPGASAPELESAGDATSRPPFSGGGTRSGDLTLRSGTAFTVRPVRGAEPPIEHGRLGLETDSFQQQQQHEQQRHKQQQAQEEGRLTHIDASGSATMVDVSQKRVTTREAQASCVVSLGEAYSAVAANSCAKGDVLTVAQLAGIMGAKATASLIPLCHNIPISKARRRAGLEDVARGPGK